jgi:hypothetical protein
MYPVGIVSKELQASIPQRLTGCCKEGTFLRNIVVWPSKKLNDGTLLPGVESALGSGKSHILPDEVQRLKDQAFAAGGGDGNSKGTGKRAGNFKRIRRLRGPAEIVGQRLVVLGCSIHDHHGSGPRSAVLNVGVANEVAVVLEGVEIRGIAFRRCLPSAVLSTGCKFINTTSGAAVEAVPIIATT